MLGFEAWKDFTKEDFVNVVEKKREFLIDNMEMNDDYDVRLKDANVIMRKDFEIIFKVCYKLKEI